MITKICTLSGKPFTIDQWELDFLHKMSPLFDGKTYEIPTPTLCPTERMIRRVCFRNERSLFYRKCDLSGKQIVAQYPTQSKFKVYDTPLWYGDNWSAYEFGRDFDFSRTFFQQFQELMQDVPRLARIQQGHNENSEYTNRASDNKNCYLLYSSNMNEDSYYGSFINDGFHCVDNTNVYGCQECYESIDCYDCQRIFWCEECKNCSDSYFLKSCVGCKNCLFCTNLIEKQYCIKNVQYSQEEYQKQLSKTDFSEVSLLQNLKNVFQKLKESMIVRYYSGTKNENVSGDHIDSSKNALKVFDIKDVEDCHYCERLFSAKNCMDYSNFGANSSWIYEVHAAGRGCSNMAFCNESWDSNSQVYYCDQCMFSNNLFGCCGVKHGSKSIMNKSYSQEEYEKLCGKIIDHMRSTGEWGEFFPHQLSPFGYNETEAFDYFPITPGTDGWIKNGTELQRGNKIINWRYDDEMSSYHGQHYKPLPIREYDERIVSYEIAQKNIDACLEGIILCEKTGKPFKIIKPELAFYIENKIAIPTFSPNARHEVRVHLRNPRILYDRTCYECHIPLKTVFGAQRKEKVVCEECYRKLVY